MLCGRIITLDSIKSSWYAFAFSDGNFEITSFQFSFFSLLDSFFFYFWTTAMKVWVVIALVAFAAVASAADPAAPAPAAPAPAAPAAPAPAASAPAAPAPAPAAPAPAAPAPAPAAPTPVAPVVVAVPPAQPTVIVVAPPAPQPVSATSPVADIANKRTPGQLCSNFASSCEACTDVHMCAWTAAKQCVEIGSDAHDKARATSSVLEACPKAITIGRRTHLIPQKKRPADIVEVTVGDSSDPEPVIATADVVAKLPPKIAIPRVGNFSLIQNQSKKAKKEVTKDAFLTPQFTF